MTDVWDNLAIILPFFCGAWALFFIGTVLRPQHFRNSIFLMGALLMTVFLIAGLFGENIGNALLIAFLICMGALMLVPIMLMINGIVMIRKESFSVPNLLSLLLGVTIGIGELAFLFGGAFSIAFSENDALAVAITFVGVSIFYFSVWMLAFVLYMISIQVIPHRMTFQYVIIHGCGLLDGGRVSKLLSNRLDEAIRIYRKCKVKPILIPSGGKGSDERLSEAEAMKNYLVEKGISESAIILEDKSETTLENLQFSKALIESRGCAQRVALVSSNYHVYRCLLFANQLKFKCVGFGAKVAWYYWPSATLREFAAVFTKRPHVIWILGGYLLGIVIPFVMTIF